MYGFRGCAHLNRFGSVFIQNTVILKVFWFYACLGNWWAVDQSCAGLPFHFIFWAFWYTSYCVAWFGTWHSINYSSINVKLNQKIEKNYNDLLIFTDNNPYLSDFFCYIIRYFAFISYMLSSTPLYYDAFKFYRQTDEDLWRTKSCKITQTKKKYN